MKKTINILRQFSENFSDSDLFYLYFIGDFVLSINIRNEFPYLIVPSENEYIQLTCFKKVQVEEVIIPLLQSVYVTLSCLKSTPNIDLIFILEYLVEFQFKKEKPTFIFFLERETKPFPCQSAISISNKIAGIKGSLHIGSSKSFKRLSALTSRLHGCLFGLSVIQPEIFSKLFLHLKKSRMKLYFPRYIEPSKVTGCDGKAKMTSYICQLKLSSVKAFSCKLVIDFPRITNPNENNFFKFVEKISTDEGTFFALYSLPFSQTYESYSQSIQVPIVHAIELKCACSDTLRAIWEGVQFEAAVQKHLKKKEIKTIVDSTFLVDIGDRPDQDSLRMYFVLFSYGLSFINKQIKQDESQYVIFPPFVYVYLPNNNLKVNETEWPFEFTTVEDPTILDVLIQGLTFP